MLYLTVPYWTGQRNGRRPSEPSRRIPEPDREALAGRLRELGRTHRADEISVTSGPAHGGPVTDWRAVPADPYLMRLWWD